MTIPQVRGYLALAALVACQPDPAAVASGPEGGTQASVQAGGNDVVNLASSADVSDLYAYDQATINYSGARVAWSRLYDHSVANVYPASTLSWMLLHDDATANINGGAISWIKLYQNARAELRSATSISWLLLNQQAQAHVYVRDFSYSGGQLSGQWASGASFSFWAINESDLPKGNFSSVLPDGLRMHVVPEPAAWLLAALSPGALMLRRRRAGGA